jgi:hypothetical protein
LKSTKKFSGLSPSFVASLFSWWSNYGGAILKMREEKIPCFMGDRAMVYRMLQSGGEGAVDCSWEMPDSAGRQVLPLRKKVGKMLKTRMKEKGWITVFAWAVCLKPK